MNTMILPVILEFEPNWENIQETNKNINTHMRSFAKYLADIKLFFVCGIKYYAREMNFSESTIKITNPPIWDCN